MAVELTKLCWMNCFECPRCSNKTGNILLFATWLSDEHGANGDGDVLCGECGLRWYEYLTRDVFDAWAKLCENPKT